jgi:hypothetical protein
MSVEVEVGGPNRFKNVTGVRFTDDGTKRVAQDMVLYVKNGDVLVPLQGSIDGNMSSTGLNAAPVYDEVTVAVTATALFADDDVEGIKEVTIRNADTQDITLCTSNGTGGLTLEPGDSRIYIITSSDVILYAKTDSDTATMEVEQQPIG